MVTERFFCRPCKTGTLVAGLLLVVTAMADSKPRLAEPYRKGFDRVWERAEAGKAPTMACASVVGTAVGMAQRAGADATVRRDAVAAAHACYVLAAAQYLERYLATASGPAACNGPIAAMAVHRSSLGGFITDLGESRADYDQRIRALAGSRVRAACAHAAAVILGE